MSAGFIHGGLSSFILLFFSKGTICQTLTISAGVEREIPGDAGHVVLYFFKMLWLPAEYIIFCVCVCVLLLKNLFLLSA